MDATYFYNRTGFALPFLNVPEFLIEIDKALFAKVKVTHGAREIGLAENVTQRLADIFIIGQHLSSYTGHEKPWAGRIFANSFYSAYMNALKSFTDACSITTDFGCDLKLKFRNQDFGQENIWQKLNERSPEVFQALLSFKGKCFEIKKERDIIVHRNCDVFHMTGDGDPNEIGEDNFELRMNRNPNVNISHELKKGNQDVLTTFDEKFREDTTFTLNFSKAVLTEFVTRL